MSRKSIKAIDAYCDVLNWDESLKNAHPVEFEFWKKRRDKSLVRLRILLAQISQEEFMRGRDARIELWNQITTRAKTDDEDLR